jgi:hypothetical protein
VFTAILKAAGESMSPKKDLKEAGGKTIFVFETGSDFGGGRRGGQPSIHQKLQSFVIKKVNL